MKHAKAKQILMTARTLLLGTLLQIPLIGGALPQAPLVGGMLVIAGCATADEKSNEPGGAVQMAPAGPNPTPHFAVIDRFSSGESEYEGFQNQFTFRATLLNEPAREALLLREADYFKWSPAQLDEAKARAANEIAEKTEVFMSFYTPDRRNDNMTDSRSIWRVYLDVGGKRYAGTAKKARKELAELQSLFPYHTRWNTPYVVTFPVPTTTAQLEASSFMVTGPLGTKSVLIPAAR